MAQEPSARQQSGPAVAALVPVAGDLERLLALFADATALSMSHWNPQSGETFSLPRGPARRAAAQAFDARMLAESEQGGLGWVEIPYQESDAAHAQAMAFAADLSPGRGRARLLRALQDDKPFRAFRAALHTMPGVLRRWQQAVLAEAEQRLVAFCLANGWVLADPRFAASLERWLDATEPAAQLPVQPTRSALRSAAALSIGRGALALPNDG